VGIDSPWTEENDAYDDEQSGVADFEDADSPEEMLEGSSGTATVGGDVINEDETDGSDTVEAESSDTQVGFDATQDDENGVQYENIPDELKEHEIWLLWDAASDTPRRPHWRGDFGITWSNPGDWHSFKEAVDAAQERDSWGIGYVNALNNDDAPRQVFSTLDLDGVLDEEGGLKPWCPPLDAFFENEVYIERSPSGTGLHIPLVGYGAPEWWTDTHLSEEEHEGVELHTNKFCTCTGDRVVGSGDGVGDIDVTPWLEEVWARVYDGAPEDETETQAELSEEYDGEWFDEETARDALKYIDPDVSYDTWRDIGFALVGEFGRATGSQLFEEWSRRGSKWDNKAKKQAKRIVKDASDWGYSGGTVVHHAKQSGWEPDINISDAATESVDGPDERGGVADVADALDVEDVSNWISKAGVKHIAGLGEEGNISDLNDREKAACVWEVIRKSDENHVRCRREDGTFWAYDDGVWQYDDDRTLRHAARKALGSMNYGDNVLREIKSQVRGDEHAEVEGDELGLDTGMLAVENGLLNLDEAAEGHGYEALRELRPEDYALTRLPVAYDPDASYDEWNDLVAEWSEEGRAEALQEYVGYCLEVGAMPVHRALLLVGGGANGKSTFLHIVRKLLGEDNITSTELQTLANERDAVADFYCALANVDDDLSSRKLGKGVGMFKKLIAGDKVRGRRLYEDAFEFGATGKHLYAANEVPDVSNDVDDEDEAFWRRWLLVEFPNHYPREERDPELRDEWTTDDALSAVLNWAIDGRRRLLGQGYFTGEYASAFEKRDRWRAWGDSIEEFISEHVEHDEDADNVSTSYAYARYKAWCRENSKDMVGQRKFTTKLRDSDVDVGYTRSVRATDTSGNPNGYKHLGVSDEVPDIQDDRADGQEGIDGFGGSADG